jgi:uridine kinase
MSHCFDEINRRAVLDPRGFVLECEDAFNKMVKSASLKIAEKVKRSKVVLLAGPSGSGKTTTAHKISDKLEEIGIKSYAIPLDKYLITYGSRAPRTADGEVDFESPHGIDLELLKEHFALLERGEEISIPHFSFKLQERDPSKLKQLKLGENEVVIFEGIHAMNDILTNAHPEAFKLYISSDSDVKRNGEIFFKRSWTRLSRRVVRDSNFRGLDASFTLKSWAMVRVGEKKYISPFKPKADIVFNSSIEYEIPVLRDYALKAFSNVSENAERMEELRSLPYALEKFESIGSDDIPVDSVMREFIGGGKYKYS